VVYELLGRAIVKVFRGYFRHAFPNARRNLTIFGVFGVVALAGISAARRRSAADASRKA
jgi:hypothetical protein